MTEITLHGPHDIVVVAEDIAKLYDATQKQWQDGFRARVLLRDQKHGFPVMETVAEVNALRQTAGSALSVALDARKVQQMLDDGRLVLATKSPMQQVAEFHRAFGHPIGHSPRIPNPSRVELRRKLLTEEFNEYLDASRFGDLVETIDALADIVYIAYGTALEYGVDLDRVLAEVHRANMSKLGDDGAPIYREDGKVMKGPNYTPPDVKRVLGIEEHPSLSAALSGNLNDTY